LNAADLKTGQTVEDSNAIRAENAANTGRNMESKFTNLIFVNFGEKECSCKDFYGFQSPCSHAISTARYENIDPITLFDERDTVSCLRTTYS
jgi:hypothetical protein